MNANLAEMSTQAIKDIEAIANTYSSKEEFRKAYEQYKRDRKSG